MRRIIGIAVLILSAVFLTACFQIYPTVDIDAVRAEAVSAVFATMTASIPTPMPAPDMTPTPIVLNTPIPGGDFADSNGFTVRLVPSDFSFTEIDSRRTEDSTIELIGRIRNDTDADVEGLIIDIVLYGDYDERVKWTYGYTNRGIIPPGKESGFIIDTHAGWDEVRWYEVSVYEPVR